MSEQDQVMAVVDAPVSPPAGAPPAAPRPQQPQAISDPRQIATVIMARMNLINAKKDELTIAIKGLSDLTQQLVQAYAGQMQVIEQLAARLKERAKLLSPSWLGFERCEQAELDVVAGHSIDSWNGVEM